MRTHLVASGHTTGVCRRCAPREREPTEGHACHQCRARQQQRSTARARRTAGQLGLEIYRTSEMFEKRVCSRIEIQPASSKDDLPVIVVTAPNCSTGTAFPLILVPVQVNASIGVGLVRSWSIGASRAPDQRPVELVLVVTSVPFARKTPVIACCPMLSIALTEDVEPIAFHETTEPLYVALPAWLFTNEL